MELMPVVLSAFLMRAEGFDSVFGGILDGLERKG